MDYETIFYDMLAIINIAFFALVKKTHDISVIIIEKVKNYDYHALGLKIAFYAGHAKQFLVETYEKNCKKGDPIDVAKENVLYYIKYLHSMVLSYRIEPLDPEWISTACIYETDFDKTIKNYTFNEIYEPIHAAVDTDLPQSDTLGRVDKIKRWYGASQNIMKNDTQIEEYLLTMKTGDKYIYKICNTLNRCCDELSDELSKIKFLNIEYNHPENEKSITIEIDRNGYVVGNEILSNTFIKRALEYMNDRKSFDMRYTLKIMDNNLDSVVIFSDEYIVLEKNSYKIMKKTGSQLSNDWVDLTTETNEGGMVEVMNEIEKALEEALEKVEDIIVRNNKDDDEGDNTKEE